MTITYNLSGAERKNLVAAISQELNTSSKYLGAPSFAYQVACYVKPNTAVKIGKPSDILEKDSYWR